MSCNNYRGISLLNTVYKVFSKILLGRLEPLAEECIGNYQCDFRKGKSTIDHLATIEQLLEKKYEYRQNIWQVFGDFKKVYDSIHRDSLYNIMYKFGFPMKLISLTKMCMNRTRYQVRVDCTLSEEFEVITGLKQGDTLDTIANNFQHSIRKSNTQCTK
uniref:Putative RNA-directed DNA polymerase n=1 Tax=Schizaphis graminum TaxID=13262 RepID=A0A2S2P765_SCHGA